MAGVRLCPLSLRRSEDCFVDELFGAAPDHGAPLLAANFPRAFCDANREAWEQSGVVKSLKWYTAEDERVCARCQDLDGTEVGIEDKVFQDSYSDGSAPPLHPDCRCYIRPELVE